MEDIDIAWLDLIEGKYPKVHRVIQAAMRPSDKSYLIYMAVRIIEMRRVLKPTGSIYLHCDPTMSHYLKLILDAVFGRKEFRNEIVWHYQKWTNAAKCFQRNHDIILFYGSSDSFNKLYGPLSKNQIAILERGYNLGSSKGQKIARVYDRSKPNMQDKIEQWEAEGRVVYDVDTLKERRYQMYGKFR